MEVRKTLRAETPKPHLWTSAPGQLQPSLPIHLRICTKKTNIAEVRHKLKLKHKGVDKSCIKQESNKNKGQKVIGKNIHTYIFC